MLIQNSGYKAFSPAYDLRPLSPDDIGLHLARRLLPVLYTVYICQQLGKRYTQCISADDLGSNIHSVYLPGGVKSDIHSVFFPPTALGRNIHYVFFPPTALRRNIHYVFFPPTVLGRNIHYVFFRQRRWEEIYTVYFCQ
jgi:hypothetical protein